LLESWCLNLPALELNQKIIAGLERIAEVFKSLLWEKAKVHGVSPIQIQILLFISTHEAGLCNVSQLAKEFGVTKPTISDAVRVLLIKEFLKKDFSPTDNRRFNLRLSSAGEQIAYDLNGYNLPVVKEIGQFDTEELSNLYRTISKLIFQLNQNGIIQVQRTCYGCRYYHGDKNSEHFCQLLKMKLEVEQIELDCREFEEIS